MSYALKTSDGKHLGFLLMIGDASEGDCIFRSLPNEPEVFEYAEAELLFKMQQLGNFRYNLESNSILIYHAEFLEEISIKENELKIGERLLSVEKLGDS